MSYWLTTRLHISWIVMIWCVAMFVGIVIAQSYIFSWATSLGWLLSGIALGVFACIRQQRWAVLLAIFSGLLIGLYRGSVAAAEQQTYDEYIGMHARLQGRVTDDIDRDTSGKIVIRLDSIRIADRPVGGTVWATITETNADIRRSDTVAISGKLSEGFGAFAASIHRATLLSIKRSSGEDVARDMRDWFASAVRTVIAEPAASLGLGFLVGQRRDLPSQLEESLRIAGLTHIIVASGYNLTILIRIARRIFEKISKYLAAVVSGGLIVGFMAVTGASPSMSRAGLVTSLALVAWYYGRNFNPFVLLAIAIALTTIINPAYAWGDIGWQLSFAAFAGVMILAPILQAYFFGDKKPSMFRQILGETVAATICTIPILLVSFGSISNIALFANLLIVPLIPLAMLAVFLSGATALVLPNIASVIAMPTTWLLNYMIFIAEWFAGLGWAVSEMKVEVWQVCLLYVVIIGAGFYMWWRTKIDLRRISVIE